MNAKVRNQKSNVKNQSAKNIKNNHKNLWQKNLIFAFFVPFAVSAPSCSLCASWISLKHDCPNAQTDLQYFCARAQAETKAQAESAQCVRKWRFESSPSHHIRLGSPIGRGATTATQIQIIALDSVFAVEHQVKHYHAYTAGC